MRYWITHRPARYLYSIKCTTGASAYQHPSDGLNKRSKIIARMTDTEALYQALRSSSSCWRFKGEGNANIVLAYTGDDPALVGKVLRLRKSKAPKQQHHTALLNTQPDSSSCSSQQQPIQQPTAASVIPHIFGGTTRAAAVSALEAEVWEPVVRGWNQLDAMEREFAFVQTVLQPYLGNCCHLAVAEATAVEVPGQLLQQLQHQMSMTAAAAVDPKVHGLLLPDVSVLTPGSIPTGYTAVGPSVCFELKPKAGIMPAQTAAVSADSIKRRYPRFVMHQLLKHIKGNSATMSRYNPLDLFQNSTGQQPQQLQQLEASVAAAAADCSCPNGADSSDKRKQLLLQQAALAALLECPYNNLKVFIDGDLVFGGKADVPVTTSRQQCRHNQQQQQQQEHQTDQQQQQWQQGQVDTIMECISSSAAAATATDSTNPANCSSSSSSSGGDDSGTEQLPAAVVTSTAAVDTVDDGPDHLISSPTWRSRRSNISELLLQLQDWPLQQQQQQNALHSPPVAAAAAAALVAHNKELLLCRVLSSILNASGILPALLHVQMMDRLDIEGIEPLFAELIQQQQQQQQLTDKSSSHTEHLALLRDYLTAATAKDCAIMITMQQVVHTQQQQQQQCAGSDVISINGSSSSSSDGSSNGVFTDSRSGCNFAWQISLVDLDLKPLSKVPQHAALDRRIVATAMQHEELLQQQLKSRDRWLNVWMQQFGSAE